MKKPSLGKGWAFFSGPVESFSQRTRHAACRQNTAKLTVSRCDLPDYTGQQKARDARKHAGFRTVSDDLGWSCGTTDR
ncbi:MAG: hypothetical protein Q4A28_06410 [Brachymonas sp.]|nr:hypothetical protein [Brachymonas sp.]